MDINKKLNFYKTQPKKAQNEIPKPLLALKNHFKGQILFPDNAILKIEGAFLPEKMLNQHLNLSLLTKRAQVETINLKSCLFFDLETTGLAGGAGTFAFLIGFAWWDGHKIETKQFFLPDYGRETELFIYLEEWIQKFKYLVSYNGKSYDLPLINNRFLLNKIRPYFNKLIHIDLLHLVRRVWKNSFERCDLQTIEQHLFNIKRVDDIPGALIPQTYFSFIKNGEYKPVINIINHNWQDIVSLIRILDILGKVESAPFTNIEDNNALILLAKLACEQNDSTFFTLSNTQKSYIKGPAFNYWQSLYYKKNKMWKEAVFEWEKLLSAPTYYFFALEELAKYYEHSAKDIKKAATYCDAAFKRFELQEELGYPLFSTELITKFKFRHERLKNKRKV